MRGTERGVGFHVLFDAVLEEVGGLRGRPVHDASGLPGEVPGVVNARFRRPKLKKKNYKNNYTHKIRALYHI